MSAPWPFLALVTLLGLLVGSFVNVVVYRVPRHESILFPASHCPLCETPIKARHNVPILGWLLLRGRCAACAERISARYPLVEAATGACYFALTLRFGLGVELPAYLFLATVAISLALIDLDSKRMPRTILLTSYAIGLVLLTFASAGRGDWHPLARAAAGAIALATSQLLFVLQLPFGGVGRLQLAGLLGLFLGWQSWSALLVGTVGALLVCAAVEIRRSVQEPAAGPFTIALAPPMVMAAGAALFITAPLVHWYGSLIGMA